MQILCQFLFSYAVFLFLYTNSYFSYAIIGAAASARYAMMPC